MEITTGLVAGNLAEHITGIYVVTVAVHCGHRAGIVRGGTDFWQEQIVLNILFITYFYFRICRKRISI